MSVNCYASYDGFTQLGDYVQKFHLRDLSKLPLDASTVVHGNIGTVRAALRQIGVAPPDIINLPRELETFAGRVLWESTLGEIRKLERVPVFIKPLREGKTFTGHVVYKFHDLLETSALDDDYAVLAQSVLNFQSEWRVFVLRGEVLGIGHYKGDPLLFPNAQRIEEVVAACQNPVVAYSVDVGLDEKGETWLVEMNDAYALGHYGLPSYRYAAMIRARWDEMCLSCAQNLT
ncbi:MAG TPA: ATP-grasp domain-containing protein [Abditibacteriaceae bacterium]|nr:ATP-grasp domain-containing protein [Abditibacteriaceae bacterium]